MQSLEHLLLRFLVCLSLNCLQMYCKVIVSYHQNNSAILKIEDFAAFAYSCQTLRHNSMWVGKVLSRLFSMFILFNAREGGQIVACIMAGSYLPLPASQSNAEWPADIVSGYRALETLFQQGTSLATLDQPDPYMHSSLFQIYSDTVLLSLKHWKQNY
ncbi:hypothetical protein DFP72DRAFT_853899 [Ephemerocybe angulata]|uniref:Uncharacterized protein n=1 Tax=Ephemerocybe angulata TaxID=980116 RepID=A0A8H6HLV0_9AGAR|nr:hypothetical protein DFP72DRAFT_853899 [Tulosesus angulatus]